MAVIPETDSRFQPEDPNGTDPAAGRQDKIDTLVFDFLQELSGLSAEIAPVQNIPTEAQAPAEKIPVFETEQHLKTTIPEPVPLKEEAVLEPEVDLAAIDREIDATLAELERRKSPVVPITDRKQSAPEPIRAPSQNHGQRAAAPSPPPSVKTAAPAVRRIEEPEWQRLEVFRTEIASSKLSRRRKTIYFTLAAVLLMAILIYFLIIGSDKFIQIFAQATNSGLCPSGTYEIHTTGINPGYPIAE